jgi:hypothetical protein
MRIGKWILIATFATFSLGASIVYATAETAPECRQCMVNFRQCVNATGDAPVCYTNLENCLNANSCPFPPWL